MPKGLCYALLPEKIVFLAFEGIGDFLHPVGNIFLASDDKLDLDVGMLLSLLSPVILVLRKFAYYHRYARIGQKCLEDVRRGRLGVDKNDLSGMQGFQGQRD